MWNSDNPVFNINGQGLPKLKEVFRLALGIETVAAWKFVKEKGLVFYSHFDPKNPGGKTPFPTPLQAEQVADMSFSWLRSPEAKTVPCEGWDANADHDGTNEPGWRVYTEEWGFVDGEHYAVAVRPVWLWYGK